MNFHFHLKSKTNLVSWRNYNLHLQYYKIDLSFSIQFQEINLYVCEEYKTEREAWDSNRTERKARDGNFFIYFYAKNRKRMQKCIREQETQGCIFHEGAINVHCWNRTLERVSRRTMYFKSSIHNFLKVTFSSWCNFLIIYMIKRFIFFQIS